MRDRHTSGPMVLGALLLAGFPQLAEAKPERPVPLPGEAGCDHYQGVPIGANDSTQQFELSVCPTADGVRAKVQTSSLVSGWSVRASTGSWDAAGRVLTLTETEFIESRPEPGWRFCLIDELVLEKTDKGLTGSYLSRACGDRAELVLDEIEPGAAAAPGLVVAPPVPSQPSQPPPRAPEITPTDDPAPQASGGCACSAATASGGESLLWTVMVIGVATARRRRSPNSNYSDADSSGPNFPSSSTPIATVPSGAGPWPS